MCIRDRTGTTLSGNWADDLLAVAESQLGYEQSEDRLRAENAALSAQLQERQILSLIHI